MPEHKKYMSGNLTHTKKNVLSLIWIAQKVNYLRELIDFMTLTVQYAKALWVISTGVWKNNLKSYETFRGQRSTMNVEKTANKWENRGCVFLSIQCEISGASPHAERMYYAEEYLISTSHSSLCMTNTGIINDETFCLFFNLCNDQNDCGSGKFNLQMQSVPLMSTPLMTSYT